MQSITFLILNYIKLKQHSSQKHFIKQIQKQINILQNSRPIKIRINPYITNFLTINIIIRKTTLLTQKSIIKRQSRTTNTYPTCSTQPTNHAQFWTIPCNTFVIWIVLFTQKIRYFQKSRVWEHNDMFTIGLMLI